MRQIGWVLFVLFSIGQAQTSERVFRGSVTLNDIIYPIRMHVKVFGQKVVGYYVHEGKDKPLRLEGTLSEAELNLKEFAGTRQTGVFKGGYTEEGLSGDWYIPSGKRGGSFAITEQDVRFSQAKLATVRVEDKAASINVLYPQFTGEQGPGWQSLNAQLRKEATDLLSNFKQPGKPSADGYLEFDYRLWLGTNRFISLTTTAGFYSPGAAHPSSYVGSYNFDPQTGKTIPLSSLFKPGSRYLQRLLEQGKRSLDAQFEVGGKSPEERNEILSDLSTEYLEWAVTPKGIRLYFSVPHVLGDFLEAHVDFSDLKDILRGDGPLSAIPYKP